MKNPIFMLVSWREYIFFPIQTICLKRYLWITVKFAFQLIVITTAKAQEVGEEKKEEFDIADGSKDLEGYHLVTHSLNYQDDILADYNNLETDISDRELILENEDLKPKRDRSNTRRVHSPCPCHSS